MENTNANIPTNQIPMIKKNGDKITISQKDAYNMGKILEISSVLQSKTDGKKEKIPCVVCEDEDSKINKYGLCPYCNLKAIKYSNQHIMIKTISTVYNTTLRSSLDEMPSNYGLPKDYLKPEIDKEYFDEITEYFSSIDLKELNNLIIKELSESFSYSKVEYYADEEIHQQLKNEKR